MITRVVEVLGWPKNLFGFTPNELFGQSNILKSHTKGTQSIRDIRNNLPSLKISFIFKVTEKFRSYPINMYGSLLFSNSQNQSLPIL